MSRGTIFGFIGGWFLVILSMRLATDNFGLFADISSAVLVLGGSYMTMFICFEAKDVIGATKEILRIFKPHKASECSYKNEVGRFVQWAYVTQKNGLQGLENEALTAVGNDEPFLRYGIELVISGYTGNEVRDVLKEACFSEYQRMGKLTEVAKQLGANTPAFGMAGTLIGLIVMLGNMSGDPGAIGLGMAVALITTFYGILAARLLYLPAYSKMSEHADDTLFRNLLITESLVLLAERKSPRYIQDRLNAYLDPSQHFLIDRDMQR